jgi:hypothetical protein
MHRQAVSDLRRLSSDLDIFTGSAPESRELLDLDLYPPLPVSHTRLIWGYHILRAAEEAGKEELVCRLLPDPGPAEMLRLALHLEARTGRYTWPEQESCLAFLTRHAPEISAVEIAPLLTGKADPRLPERIDAFSRLALPLKTLVAGGLLDLKSALRLRSLPESVFRRLAGAGEALTFSRRRLLLNQLEEIRRRERLQEPELLRLLSEALEAEDPPAVVRRRRYPVLTGLEERFRALKRDALEGSGIRLEAPECFEGENFTVSFSFRNRAGLARKLTRLRALEDKSDELFTLLR